MKNLLLLIFFFVLSCKSSQKSKTENKPILVTNNEVALKDSVPICIEELIKKIALEPITSPPSKVYRYTFDGKTVYYVPPVCCDNFSDLYNDSCKIIAHPDGGFTGRGDGRAASFNTTKKNEKLIWEDKSRK